MSTALKVNAEGRSVLQNWVHGLPFMQQTVLLAALRGPDGVAKNHVAKDIQRYLRRCVLICATTGGVFQGPYEPGGGSFMGPIRIPNLETLIKLFIDSYDRLPAHYWAHVLHAAEILGYKHPHEDMRKFWFHLYERMVESLHLCVELECHLDNRLGDQ